MFKPSKYYKVPGLPVWFGRGPTAYEVQIGPHNFRWCYLMGGEWRSWLQLDRFHYWKDTNYGQD